MIEKLGKYEIRRMLGRGAMGIVYEGYDPLIKRSVALKTIRADQLQGDAAQEIIARFRREAEAVGRLNHPNIVCIYEFAEDDGTWFIAMELVKGRELKELFEANERFRLPDVERLMTQVLAALEYSHRHGVVHRDIKPANIFVCDDGTAKVADFGIAHIESSNLTQVGTTIGTPSYMSPEQIMGLPVDGRSDLFSAGVLLYQLLTGERPFAGSSNTTMQKVLKEDPLPPSALNLQVSAAMDGVVRKALAKHADQRFQSAREFADALRAAAHATAVDPEATVLNVDAVAAAKPRPPAPPAPATVNPVPVTPAASNANPAAPGKPRTLTVAVLVSAAAIAVGAAAWYLSQRATTNPSPATAATQPATMTPGAPPGAAAGTQPVAATTVPSVAPKAAVKTDPGTVVISAVGVADPSNPRYQADKTLLQGDLRADSRSQVVEKALGLLVDRKSLATHYDVVQSKLLSQSGSYINTVMQESEPRAGKDGLMSMTTQAVVNVRALQKSLNQMSRDERIELIRAKGDPRIMLRIAVRDADRPDVPPMPSPVAENIVKERIKSFGFRTWSADGPDAATDAADFVVQGEANVKRLSMRLEASGLTVTKYALTSWTVKCIDRATGEEVYYNTTLPKGLGSWATEEEALRAIGTKIGEEFSRDFFLQHVSGTGQKVALVIAGVPEASEPLVVRELIGLPAVMFVRPAEPARAHTYEVQLAGSGLAGDIVASDLLPPLNAKLGQACFGLGTVAGDQVTVNFDARCADPAVLSRLETNPPAALYGAPPARLKAIVANPGTRRKLTI